MRRWEFRAADMPRFITDGYIVGYDRIKGCYNIYRCGEPSYDLILISSLYWRHLYCEFFNMRCVGDYSSFVLYKIEREITRYEEARR